MTHHKNINNFDIIRIVAALAVLFSHHFALYGRMEPAIPDVIAVGGVAVMIFFSISGFLVTQSWVADPHVIRFALRRALRIWPALIVVVTFTALVIGPLLSTLPQSEYLQNPATWDYFRNLAMRTQFVLPGVFADNPGSSSVNGSLWTIPIEVTCYLAFAAIGLMGLLRGPRWILAWCMVFAFWYISKGMPDRLGYYTPTREFSAYFIAGVALWCLKEKWLPHRLWWMLGALIAGSVLFWLHWRYLALLVIIPVCTIGIGMRSTPLLRQSGRFGDPSFGIYLWAFPVQQSLIHLTYPEWSFKLTLALAIIITTVLAYLSWAWIEKPALRLKPRRRSTH